MFPTKKALSLLALLAVPMLFAPGEDGRRVRFQEAVGGGVIYARPTDTEVSPKVEATAVVGGGVKVESIEPGKDLHEMLSEHALTKVFVKKVSKANEENNRRKHDLPVGYPMLKGGDASTTDAFRSKEYDRIFNEFFDENVLNEDEFKTYQENLAQREKDRVDKKLLTDFSSKKIKDFHAIIQNLSPVRNPYRKRTKNLHVPDILPDNLNNYALPSNAKTAAKKKEFEQHQDIAYDKAVRMYEQAKKASEEIDSSLDVTEPRSAGVLGNYFTDIAVPLKPEEKALAIQQLTAEARSETEKTPGLEAPIVREIKSRVPVPDEKTLYTTITDKLDPTKERKLRTALKGGRAAEVALHQVPTLSPGRQVRSMAAVPALVLPSAIQPLDSKDFPPTTPPGSATPPSPRAATPSSGTGSASLSGSGSASPRPGLARDGQISPRAQSSASPRGVVGPR